MKTLKFVLLAFSAAALLGTLSNCKGKDDPTPSQAQTVTDQLVATWQIQSLSIDDVNHTDLFATLKLTFTATGFTAQNGAPVWPASGTWQFTDKTATAFTRNDGTEVTISEISDTKLVLSLTWTKTTLGGRVTSISGKNVFTFTK